MLGRILGTSWELAEEHQLLKAPGSMECKAWLHDEEGGALANPFKLFQDNETTDLEIKSDYMEWD
ncbi:hypothetical protein ACHAW6_003129 [Cyclotella cf. meneghiniana]